MKDELLSEEYCNEMMCTVCSNIICGYKGKCTEWETRKRYFLAGLKAGRPQWHKPGEKLPDQYDNVLNEDGFGVFYDGKYWRNNDAEQDICDEPKYWCEIPTFDKE